MLEVWQDSEFASVAGKNLRKNLHLKRLAGFSVRDFEFAFVAINDFDYKIYLRCLTGF